MTTRVSQNDWRVRVTPSLTTMQVDDVRLLAQKIANYDGFNAFDEQTLLNLNKSDRSLFILAEDSQSMLLGATILNLGNGTCDLGVDPEYRRQGIGSSLLDEVITRKPSDWLGYVWAHGTLLGAQSLAGRFSLKPARELLVMEHELGFVQKNGSVPPKGEVISLDFVPLDVSNSDDVDALVTLNSQAFASHPEQGILTHDDFRERFSQPWFDPNLLNFIVRTDNQQKVGFIWLKPESLADVELYVLGVHPDFQGRGIAKVALNWMKAKVHECGFNLVRLYVDRSNFPAVHSYEKTGFNVTEVHTCYQL